MVPTDGKNTVCLQSLVVSFSSEMGSSPAEIIIVGPPAYQPQLDTSVPTSTIAFHELGWSPGWITRKKNLGVANARFDKVVVCHDYIEFQPGWKTGFDKFGEDFDVCMNRVVLQDGRRTRDWMAWDYPGIGPGLLPYDASCPQYQYISGTYFVVKRDFFLANGLDERLRWGDAEDVEWSRRIRLVANYRMNPWSTVRFSKPKPANDAPYCDNWIENTAKLEALFGDAQTVAP